MDSQRLLDLRADAHERVHRGHRLLKDHAELAALNGAQLRAGQAQNIAPVDEHLARERDLLALDEARERHGGHGLAAAALAHEPDDLAVADRQVNARHSLARGAVKADVQIMNFDHGDISFPEKSVLAALQALADQAHAENQQHNDRARAERVPRRRIEHALRFREHIAEARLVGRNAD